MKTTLQTLFIGTLILLGIQTRMLAQCTAQGAYEGTDFWVGFAPNEPGSSTLQLQLTSRCAASATITTPAATGAGTLSTVVAIAANTIVTQAIAATYGTPAVNMQEPTANTPINNGIHVVSNVPITLYGMNQVTASLDSWISIATPNLGTDYISVAFTGSSNPTNSEVLVLATAPGTTTVSYTVPAPKTVSGQGSSFTATLTQGQTYLIIGPGDGATDHGELTGIHIVANKNIAVFGGVDEGEYPEAGNRIPGSPSVCGPLDHFIEMLTPSSSWGGTYVVPRWALKGADATASGNITTEGSFIRIISGEINPVTVSISGQANVTLNFLGDYADRIITQDAVITSNGKKIATYEIMAGAVCYSAVPSTGKGDGDLCTIAPAEQWGTQYTFSPPPGGTGRTHYCSIVKRGSTAADGGITLNGTAQTGFTQVGTSRYWALTGISLTSGTTYAAAGDSIFIVYQYGIEVAGSYSNPVSGSKLAPILMPVSYTNFTAKAENKQVQLNWAVAEEINAKEYVIEKVLENGSYSTLGSVPAGGNSSTARNYTFQDAHPTEGANYYRLKQLDYDDKASYSSVALANVPLTQAHIEQTKWVDNTLEIVLTTANADVLTLALYDMQGRCIKKQTNTVGANENTNLVFDTSNISNGVYIVAVTGNNSNTLQQVKVVK